MSEKEEGEISDSDANDAQDYFDRSVYSDISSDDNCLTKCGVHVAGLDRNSNSFANIKDQSESNGFDDGNSSSSVGTEAHFLLEYQSMEKKLDDIEQGLTEEKDVVDKILASSCQTSDGEITDSTISSIESDDSEDDMNLLKLRFKALQSAVKIKASENLSKKRRLPSPPRHRHYFQKSSTYRRGESHRQSKMLKVLKLKTHEDQVNAFLKLMGESNIRSDNCNLEKHLINATDQIEFIPGLTLIDQNSMTSHLNTESMDSVFPQLSFQNRNDDKNNHAVFTYPNNLKSDQFVIFEKKDCEQEGLSSAANSNAINDNIDEKINTLLEDVRKESLDTPDVEKLSSNSQESSRVTSPSGDIVLEEVEKEEREREKEAANLRREIDLLQEQILRENLVRKQAERQALEKKKQAENSTKKNDDILKKMRENILNRMNSKTTTGKTIKKSASSPAFLKQLSKTKEIVIKLGEDSTSSESDSDLEKRNLSNVNKQELNEKTLGNCSNVSTKAILQEHRSLRKRTIAQTETPLRKTCSPIQETNETDSINLICKQVLNEIIDRLIPAKPRKCIRKLSKVKTKSSKPNLKLSKVLERKLVAVEGEWKKQKLLRLKYKMLEERKRTKLDEQELTSVGNLRAQRRATILKEKKRLKKLEEQLAVAKRVITTSEEQLSELDKKLQVIRERLATRRSNELSLRQELETLVNQPNSALRKSEPEKIKEYTFDDVFGLKEETINILNKQLSNGNSENTNKLYMQFMSKLPKECSNVVIGYENKHPTITFLNFSSETEKNTLNKKIGTFSTGKFTIYDSPLKAFRLYRFKDHSKLNSSIYSYYHSADRILCRYHLNGKCQDEKCNNLHLAEPSIKEILLDLVSYVPTIAGVSRTTPTKQIPMILENYIVDFMRDKQELNKEDCLALMMRLIKQKVQFSSVFDLSRKWNPFEYLKETSAVHSLKLNCENDKAENKRVKKQYDLVTFDQLCNKTASDKKESVRGFQQEIEETINSKDIRYWLNDNQSCIGKELESAVKTEKSNISLWLRFAYSKLHDSNGADYDSALKILAKAIQTNEKESLLWIHYLTLYEKSERQSSLKLVYQMALKKAPTYNIWWKYLMKQKGVEAVCETCDKIIAFIMGMEKNDIASHYLLEVTIYKATILRQAGLYNEALKFLDKSRLNKDITTIMNTEDLSVLLFTFIYLAEFSTIPSAFFDPAQSIPSKIVRKTALYMAWKSGTKKTKLKVSTLDSLFKQAFVRLKGRELKGDNCINLAFIDKEIVLGKTDKAKIFVETKIKSEPNCVILWKYLKKICSITGESFCSDFVDLECASSELTFFLAISVETKENALKIIEDYPKKILKNPVQCERNIVIHCYLKLIKEPLPLDGDLPELKNFKTEEDDPFTWLCYCYYLQASEFNFETIKEAFECALCRVKEKNSYLIWKSYLKFINENCPKKLWIMVRRCLASTSVNINFPYSNLTFLDCDGQNEIFNWLFSNLTTNDVLKVEEKLIEWMPRNPQLVCRLLKN
ncbi:DgyrCDS5997 [Dimorphilus gyrociliatus]|uniref:DgyrCDS5997 n=1 Tax=Dimorphilus gyrociliatus TaxID=2664684 RepID=A0A7I8VLT7_9ANNE|nr:DgyrCDS5997 [Dimorphilus gyrociliatus]